MERLPTVERLRRRAIRLAVVIGVITFWYLVAAGAKLDGPSTTAGWASLLAIGTSMTLLAGGAWPRR